MKTNLLNTIAIAIVMTTCYNCSVEPMDNLQTETLEQLTLANMEQASTMICNGSNPKARIANNGTLPADYQIYDSTGVMIDSINDIQPGTVSDWITFPEGIIIFNVVMDSFSDQKVSHNMATCTEIFMEIDANNQLTEVAPQASPN